MKQGEVCVTPEGTFRVPAGPAKPTAGQVGWALVRAASWGVTVMYVAALGVAALAQVVPLWVAIGVTGCLAGVLGWAKGEF